MPTFSGTPGNDNQTTGFDILYGEEGNDRLGSDQPGPVLIDGGPGWDGMDFSGTLTFGKIYGGDGSDVTAGHLLADELYGGAGDDLVAGGHFLYPEVEGWIVAPTTTSGNDTLFGEAGADAIYGFDGDDVLFGGDGDDRAVVPITVPTADHWTNGSAFTVQSGLYGGEGNDTIYGDSGLDTLYGGHGTDRLHGDDGADVFQFEIEKETPKGKARDVIFDFSREENDAIHLYYMDAKAKKSGDQAFKFIGKDGFHDKAGELRFDDHKLSGDTDGDGKADFEVKILGVNSLKVGDFYL